jgi:hypothetical protein
VLERILLVRSTRYDFAIELGITFPEGDTREDLTIVPSTPNDIAVGFFSNPTVRI